MFIKHGLYWALLCPLYTINCLVFVITQCCGPHVSCFSAIAGSNTADNVLLHFGGKFCSNCSLGFCYFHFSPSVLREELEDNFLPLDSEFSLHFPWIKAVCLEFKNGISPLGFFPDPEPQYSCYIVIRKENWGTSWRRCWCLFKNKEPPIIPHLETHHTFIVITCLVYILLLDCKYCHVSERIVITEITSIYTAWAVLDTVMPTLY